MRPSAQPPLDARDAARLLAELRRRLPGYVPEWQPAARGADAALLEVAARYAQTLVQRLDQAPDKNLLAFLAVLGIRLVPAQAARAPVVLRLAASAADARAPAGSRVSAPPPPEQSDQVLFETEQAVGLATARLEQVVSLWPGRDEYRDHSEALAATLPFRPFRRRDLLPTPHHLYLAHDTLLALAGTGAVDLLVDLATAGNEALDVLWKYWDGQVWREFQHMRPACGELEAGKKDGTQAWRRSGLVRLEVDCAETARTTVDGVEAHWIRGELTEPLPQDPNQVLPEVESIRLKTDIQRGLAFVASTVVAKPMDGADRLVVKFRDGSGKPLVGMKAVVKLGGTEITSPSEVVGELRYHWTNPATGPVEVRVELEMESETDADYSPPRAVTSFEAKDPASTYELTFALTDLALDRAFANQLPLDVTQTFQPFGPNAGPGSAFYFSNEEIFSKPGARLEVLFRRGSTAGDSLTGEPIVSWEYWNGTSWCAVAVRGQLKLLPNAKTFGLVRAVIPDDMAPLLLNGQLARWMRARVVQGTYAVARSVHTNDPQHSTFDFDEPQPPSLADFRLGYIWQHGPLFPEQVRTFNDFRYEDHTEDNRWPGQPYQPFAQVRDVTPALYLGFSQALPVDRLNLFFDIEEVRGDTRGPALLWQYFDGFGWKDLAAADETRFFRVPGMVSLIGPSDSQALARFGGTARHWLRARLKADGPPGNPTLRGVFPNAVWAAQHTTTLDEPVGASTGRPNQVFALRQAPVLDGVRIEVRELGGLRANTEWRILATELLGEDPRRLADIERRLAAEGPATEVQVGDLRLRRDRVRRVTEAWVAWQERPHLGASQAGDRHFLLDPARGRLLFGDGTQGRVPPPGAAILVRRYRSGGGVAGNVPQGALRQLVGPLGGVEAAFNPIAAGGGADGEALARVAWRGPRSLRHRGRALAAADYEALAYEANAAVAVARALPCRDPAGRSVPGWVTLIIIPRTLEDRPWPSFGLREEIRAAVAARASADLASAAQIFVTGPDYTAVDVAATIVPADAGTAGEVERAAREALATFLHPLRGGPDGEGSPPGRSVYLSDVAAVLERVVGVDAVPELTLLRAGVPQGERIAVSPERIVVAGDVRLMLVRRRGPEAIG